MNLKGWVNFLIFVGLMSSVDLAAAPGIPDIYNLIHDYTKEDYDRYYGRFTSKKDEMRPTTDVKKLLEEKKIHIHFNGYTLHITNDDPEINSFLYGAGITWDIHQFESDISMFDGSILALEADAANDSLGQFAYLVGASWRKRVLPWVALGINAGIMNKQNVKADSGYPVFPYAFPFVQTTFDFPVNLRFMWVPPVRKKTDNQIMMQLLYSF